MLIVKETDGVWSEVEGTVHLQRMATEANIVRLDGTAEPVAVKPYEVTETLSIPKVKKLLVDKLWTEDDIAPYGLRLAKPFVTPDGKVNVGRASYQMVEGEVHQIFDIEDLPPPSEVTDYQFFQALAKMGLISEQEALDSNKGVIPSTLMGLIDTLPEDERFGAKMTLSGATSYHIDHPLTNTLARAMNWTPKQKNELFRLAGSFK